MIKPIADRVLIKADAEENVTEGGIIIPDTAKQRPQKGVVIATGDALGMTVRKGDNVLYAKAAGTNITVDGDDYIIMREADIYLVL